MGQHRRGFFHARIHDARRTKVMNNEEARSIVNSKLKFVLGGIALIAVAVLLVAAGFVEGLYSGCIAAIPAILGVNLLVMAYKSAATRS
jgi:hypothetical protein